MSRLELLDVSVRLPTSDGDVPVLDSTTLHLTEQRIALIGANGSGKSTLARLLNGLVTATTGQVLVDGLDVATEGPAVRRKVAFCFTDPSAQLVMPTVVEDVALSLRRHHRDK
ncbi:MAG: ATP-binding cassette domain-containing protein, partial [Nocardioides sp.]